MSVCEGCENLVEGECRVFDGPPIPGADGSPCRARGWVWLNGNEEKEARPKEPRRTVLSPERVKARREALGLSQNQLAKLSGHQQKDIGLIEAGKKTYCTRRMVEDLTRVLGCREEELTG